MDAGAGVRGERWYLGRAEKGGTWGGRRKSGNQVGGGGCDGVRM